MMTKENFLFPVTTLNEFGCHTSYKIAIDCPINADDKLKA
jgi:hypothetical protein